MGSIPAAAGWVVTEWTIALAAFLTSAGVIWRKVVVPVRGFVRKFKAWMVRVETSIALVEEQMKPNSGTTLLDRVTANTEKVKQIDRNVQMLLEHDRERDQPGRRYGGDETT